MGRISPGPTRWAPGAERRLVPAKSNLKPQTCAFRELCLVALLVVPGCPLRVCALALPRRPLPPPLGGVVCAPRTVPALGAGRAVPRGPRPSTCPALVPCSVWRAWGRAVRSRLPPTWLGLHALWGLRAAGVVGGRPRGGGWPATVVRGVWCQASPSPDRPSSGAGSRGTATRVFLARSVWAWGPSTSPTACALAGRRCSLWEWRNGVPVGGAFHRCEGRLRSGAPPPPTARPLGGLFESATHVLWAQVCGCGGPTLSPWPACPVGAACRGGGGGLSPGGGGWPATVVRGVWCQALSLLRPPVLWGGRPGFRDPCVPGAVGAGVGTQHRPHSVRPCGPALLAIGVAEGRPRRGCLPPL